MNWKHTKFEESATMRSLIKVAQEKNLLTLEEKKVAVKTASSKTDFTPSDSLLSNILKLCGGLREQGFEDYAHELENNFIAYKTAVNLYETSKETGEDLVHEAHPKGSHKLEGVEGDAVVETIIDQHLKNLQIVNKKPTGKLSNAKSIIDAVKIVLADDLQKLQNKLQAIMKQIKGRANMIAGLTENELTRSWSPFANQINVLAGNPTVDNIRKIQDVMNNQAWRLKPGLIMGISEDTWSKVLPQINSINTLLADALTVRQEINATTGQRMLEEDQYVEKEEAPTRTGITVETSPTTSSLIGQMNKAFNDLSVFRSAIATDPTLPPPDKQSALGWIEEKTGLLSSLKQELGDDIDHQNQVSPGLLANLRKITLDFEDFRHEWVG